MTESLLERRNSLPVLSFVTHKAVTIAEVYVICSNAAGRWVRNLPAVTRSLDRADPTSVRKEDMRELKSSNLFHLVRRS